MPDPNTITQFYIESHRVVTQAHFIIQSLPNADLRTVERMASELDAIRCILVGMDDQYTTPEEISELIDLVDTLLHPLEQFISSPPPPANTHIPRAPPTGRRGRPSYTLDTARIQELHNLGNSWVDIANTLGVSRKTLYNHLRAIGVRHTRRAYTDLDDDELDALVKEISQNHPYSGSTIIQGHLEARNIHIPRLRVQESLRRVDAVGVLVRYVLSLYQWLQLLNNWCRSAGQVL